MNLLENMKKLGNAHGVSGNEAEASCIAKQLLLPNMNRVEIDEFGNVSGYRFCERPNAFKLMLDAHIDQVGYIVRQITDDGFVCITEVAADRMFLPGKVVAILTKGGIIRGIVSILPPNVHISEYAGNEPVPTERLYIDVGMTGEQARELIDIGDYVVWDNNAIELQGGVICGKASDDRAGFLAIAYAMELLKDKNIPVDLIVVGSTKEETDGHGAKTRAYRDQPDMIIAFDVGGPENYGNGPIIPVGPVSRSFIAERFKSVAKSSDIPFINRCSPGVSGTNAKHFQTVDHGFKTAYISMPQKYMHTPTEMVTVRDIELTGKLIAQFVLSLELPLKEVHS